MCLSQIQEGGWDHPWLPYHCIPISMFWLLFPLGVFLEGIWPLNIPTLKFFKIKTWKRKKVQRLNPMYTQYYFPTSTYAKFSTSLLNFLGLDHNVRWRPPAIRQPQNAMNMRGTHFRNPPPQHWGPCSMGGSAAWRRFNIPNTKPLCQFTADMKQCPSGFWA